jgi:Outer membrane protein beta-barrel domain
MSSPFWISKMLHASIVTAAVAFAAGPASAQFTMTSDSSSTEAPSAVESSSSASPLLTADGGIGAAALPAAPAAGQNGSYGEHGGYHSSSFTSHLTFEAGGGFNGPVGDTSTDMTWGGNLTVGAGYSFSKRISALMEYQFLDNKAPGSLIAEAGAQGGYVHLWSFTVDPVIDLFPKSANTVYVTGGGGFYRKVTSFTDPTLTEECYFYCGYGYVNSVVSHFSSNQGGWNVGAGYMHKLGGMYGDSRMKIFAEARYLDVLSPAIQGLSPNGQGLITTVPADSKLIPVTFGVRF